jgi:pentatricopeptide repeat protein
MKYLIDVLQASFVMVVTTIFVACAPVIEKPQQNDFFEPVNRVVHKKAGSDSLVMTREIKNTDAEDTLKDSLIVLYQQQNKRLNDMIQQLNQLTKKNMTGNYQDTGKIDEILANRKTISNEMLLEKIKNQNQRLNDVLEQLKLFSKSQQNQNENISQTSEGVNVVTVKPSSGQQVPVLITGAHALPVKSAPAMKYTTPRTLNPSLSYGKAIELYKKRQYDKAIDMFEKMLIQKIEPNLADRYHFWMGVCYLNLNKSNQAIKEFASVLGYSHSEKAEEAYFMIGQCYERTGAKNSAKVVYEKMLKLYPQGNLKRVAEKKLALLK